MMDRLRLAGTQLLRGYSSFAIALFLLLLVLNLIAAPQFLAPAYIAGTLAVAAPLAIAGMAETAPVLSGGGGIDLSVGPLLGWINVLIIVWLIPHHLTSPWVAIPLLLAVGASVGLVNGVLVAVVRLQPIVATLGTYLVLTGISLQQMPQPVGQAPHWIIQFDGSFGPLPGAVILVGVPALAWLALSRTPYLKTLLAVGGEARAAYSAGVNVMAVRIFAYVIAGILAAVAGIALTALVQSGDATLGTTYTLLAITAVALGGTSLAGGVGGLVGSILGAADIYLIQNLLTSENVSSFWLQVAYGGILVVALVANSSVRQISLGAIRGRLARAQS
jgi:ribose transport system permease protein